MKYSRYFIVIAILIIGLFAVSAYFYSQLPDRLASHWNAAGEADGYSSRFWGLFTLPLIAAGTTILLLIIPRLDPMRANIEKFQKGFYGFIIFFLLFFLYLHLLTIIFNLGNAFNMTLFLLPAFAALFFFMGIMIGKAKRNYSIGIRTPWTLSSDVVWEKTHALGGVLFKLAALISLAGLFFSRYAIWFLIMPVLIASGIAFIYSYLAYRKEVGTAEKG